MSNTSQSATQGRYALAKAEIEGTVPELTATPVEPHWNKCELIGQRRMYSDRWICWLDGTPPRSVILHRKVVQERSNNHPGMVIYADKMYLVELAIRNGL